MYILDTNILIWILQEGRGRPLVFETIQKLLRAKPEETGLSVVTVAEIYKNIQTKEVPVTEQIINKHIIFPFTVEIAKIGGYYWQDFHLKFKELNLLDCLIAATTKEQKATLITLNDRHFPMTDITVINPL